MPNQLPPQQVIQGTYMEIRTTAWRIKNRLVLGQPEGETSLVWNDILHEVFPPREDFSTGPEMEFGGGRADLFTAHMVFEPRALEKVFIIVECKAPGYESQSAIWDEGVQQVGRYLTAVADRARPQIRRFGAVAVGRTVRFYEFVDKNLIDFGSNGRVLYLDRQCQDVTNILRQIKSTV